MSEKTPAATGLRALIGRAATWLGRALGLRAYEAAGVNRLTGPWASATSTSANKEVHDAQPLLRNRWRELVRNNAHAARIMDVRVGAIVGAGHTPRPACMIPGSVEAGRAKADNRANAKALALWNRWARECDAEGDLPFAALQTVAARAWQEGGDCLIRRRRRRMADGLSVPLQIQVLEGDFLDHSQDGLATSSGGRTVQGVEFDVRGRRTAYWIYKSHPGDSNIWPGDSGLSVRIKAADVAHLYTADRAGQVRGVPCGSAVAADLRQLDRIEEAVAVKLRMESCVAAFIQYENVEDATLAGWTQDSAGNPTDRFGPGMVIPTPFSKQVTFSQPTGAGNADALMLRHLHAVAAGSGTPYELMTGDLSSVNYSSIRAGLIEFRRAMKGLQAQQFQPLLLDRVWSWFIEAAVLSGALEDRPGGYPVIWQAPRFEEVDRQTDATADEIVLRNGGTHFGIVAAEHGQDPDDLMAEIARWRDKAQDLGLTFAWMQPRPGAAPDPVQASEAGSVPAGLGAGESPPPPDPAAPSNGAAPI